ncbi:putative uncharacterized protein [Clostridium sp. CAG:921]|nr:putative uncharacterized protein [Clostridium sp. CAG:921]
MKDKISKTKMLGIVQKIITFLFLFIVFIVFCVYKLNMKTQITYTVINGYIEKIADAKSYVLKNENVITVDKDKTFIPIVQETKRVAKDETIAIYKNNTYDNYLKNINELDDSIETLVKDLPTTYSADISKINAQIEVLTEKSNLVNSYVKMQEFKSKLDELSYKKISLFSELSPAGSKIRELIEKRKKIEEEYKNSESNIKSTIPGIVSYKIDGLEENIDFKNILDYSIEDFEEMIEKYDATQSSNVGIKIVNNYKAYLLVKTPISETNDGFMQEDKKYTLRLVEEDSKEVSSYLRKIIKKDEYNYLVFEITNYIENLVDIRTTSIEIVWNRVDGMAVLKKAIKKKENEKYDYVTLVNGGQLIEIPIKILSSSDTVCIVENLTSSEKEELGITTNATLELYDVLAVDE